MGKTFSGKFGENRDAAENLITMRSTGDDIVVGVGGISYGVSGG